MRYIGIDFGTSTFQIAYRDDKDSLPQILPIGREGDKGLAWMPSVVTETEPYLVGEEAIMSGECRSVKNEINLAVLNNDNSFFQNSENQMKLKKQIKAIFTEAMNRALTVSKKENFFKDAKVFIGCPAFWNLDARKLVANVAIELGLNVDVPQIIEEPVAAGLFVAKNAERDNGNKQSSGQTLIFDAGGGTIDIAYLNIHSDNPNGNEFKVSVFAVDSLVKSGDMADEAISEYLRKRESTLVIGSLADKTLLDSSRKLKERLSGKDEKVSDNAGFPISKTISLSLIELDEVVKDLVKESMILVRKVIKSKLLRDSQEIGGSEIRKRDFQELARDVRNVVLVGGFSQLKLFGTELKTLFPNVNSVDTTSPEQYIVKGLTYGNKITSPKTLKPPFNFVVRSEKLDKGEITVYRAYEPLFSQNDFLKGNLFLSTRVDLCEFGDGEFSLHCELPDRERTEVNLKVVNEEGNSLPRFRQDLRSIYGHVVIIIYATGDICVRGFEKEYLINASSWEIFGRDNKDLYLECARVRTHQVS